jgi:transposase
MGHEVRVVPGHLVRSLGVGYRQMKSDEKDARALSEVSTRIDLPSVHLRSKPSREIQMSLKMRVQLVATRTQLINSVRGWMRTQTLRLKSGATHTFPQRLREKKVELPTYVQRQLDQIDSLTQALENAEIELSQIAHTIDGLSFLQSIPGVGLLTSLCFVSVIDGKDRFQKAHHFQSYVGLTPGEKSSGGKQRTTSITKAGSSMLRYLLIQAAWTVYTHRSYEPMVVWAKRIEQRRGKKIAMVALARKLAGIMFAVWKTQRPYQPKLSAQ